MAYLEIKNLYKIFGPEPKKVLLMLKNGANKDEILGKTGNTVGLSNVSFQVNKGEIFVIMGLSGSGKSTLLRCLNRLIEPTDGQILVDGEDILSVGPEKLRELRQNFFGMVFQRFALLPHRTVVENVAFGLELRDMPLEERTKKAQEILEMVNLDGYFDVKPGELSGGMQQRVGLARALAVNPHVLLMDEPFSALDPLIRREMQHELLALQDKMDKTIIFITHDLDEALRLGDRIAVLKDGQVRQIGTPEEILRNPADDYVSKFVGDVDPKHVLIAKDVMIKPEVLVSKKTGLLTAIQIMRKAGFSSVFVVDRRNKLLGVVTIDDALVAQKAGKDSLEGALIQVQAVRENTPLKDLIPRAAEAAVPIPVVDEKGSLQGIIVRVSILAGLTKEVAE